MVLDFFDSFSNEISKGGSDGVLFCIFESIVASIYIVLTS